MVCQEKNKYSKQTAEKVRKYMSERDGLKLKVYLCEDCNKYHLTHVTNWVKKSLYLKRLKRKK